MIAQIDRVAFNLLGIPIYWYALIIVSGIIIAMWLSSREAVRVGLKSEDVTDFMLWGLPLSIIGARLYYILFDLPQYITDPIQIFNIRSGGLAIYGGLIAGAITLYFFTKYHFISMWTFLDIAAPSVLLAQAIGRWGNFMNHEAYGPVTTRIFLENLHIPRFIIDNMYIEGFYRQPTFLYESVWSLIGFILLLFLRNKKHLLKKGEVLLVYVMWYSFGRFFIEGLRTDSLYFLGVIRISQLLSAFLFVGTIILFIWRRKKGNLPDYDRTFGKNQMII
ncbi:TPA: prolipoprotein diacylglyceryl transferase [Enterococcus hirae]|uniref:prolipoprotein diacylglyceryl transferase n=1 Tax=Enterococcus hirae TaxID=1354 RepID=UPI000BBCE83B|nr:prolipoprotein diacylglyceryl transferase [Enterococcus hirae]PCE05437.1 prolipoprotein diacylglyceryl transferase [Enterococcus hirae]RBT68990.1 prolipoprotein diacylglyceryl transferase [Enterococcus hirae]